MGHTPGPWEVTYDHCDCGGDYPCRHGEFAYELVARGKTVERYGQPWPATLANFVEAGDATEADIRLIEAAPDLYDVAETLLVMLDGGLDIHRDRVFQGRNVCEQLRAAVSKARGRDQTL